MKRKRAVEIASLAGALALGGILRFGWPGVSPFAYDEARLSYLALALARYGRIPITGMVSSVGAPNMPASVWAFAIPYAISTNPLLAVTFVAALNLVAVLALWWMARRMWGSWAGTAAAWMLAGSPYATFYSRSVWAQDLLIPLAVLWAISMLLALEKEDWRWAALAGFLAGLTAQVHYSGFVLPLLTVLLLLMYRRFRELVPMTIGAALSAATAIPFLLHLLRGDIRLSAGSHGIRFGIASLRHIVALASGYDWGWLLLGKGWALSRSPAALVAGAMLALFAVSGMVVMLFGRRRKGRGIPASLTLLWALAGPLLWTVHFTTPNLHYQLVSLPAWFLAAGFAVAALPQRQLRAIALSVVVAASLVQGAIFAAGVARAGRDATPGGIGAPLAYHLRAVSAAKDGNPVIAIVPGDDPGTDGDAAILEVLLWGYPHRLIDGRHALVLPNAPSNLLFVAPWLPAWSEFSDSVAGAGGVRYIPRRSGEYPYLLVRLDGDERPAGFHEVRGVSLSNGASLEGWKAEWSESGFRFVTLWTIAHDARGRDFHQFNHLYVGNAPKPAIGRDMPVSSRAWRAGDRLIAWADFPPPPEGRLRMGVGMYDYPSLERVPRRGVSNPLAPIMLGPLR